MSKTAVELTGVSVTKVAQFVKKTYLAMQEEDGPLAVLLLGPPGVGKTVAVKDVASELAEALGRRFIEFGRIVRRSDFEEVAQNAEKYFVLINVAVTHLEPADLAGYPRPLSGDGDQYIVMTPVDWAYLLSREGAAGVLFLDEVTLDSRQERRAAMFKILDERLVGFRYLTEKVMVVTAGNTDKHTSMAIPLPDPILRGRVLIINVAAPTVEEWIDWMNRKYGDEWEKRIAAFLLNYREYLWTKAETDEGFDPRASPRNWTKLARLLYLAEFEDEEVELAVKGLVPANVASLLLTFLKTYVPSLEEIKDPEKLWDTLQVEGKYIVTVMLSQRTPEELTERFAEFLVAMAKDREFLELLKRLMTPEKRKQFLVKLSRRLPSVYSIMKENFLGSENLGLEEV